MTTYSAWLFPKLTSPLSLLAQALTSRKSSFTLPEGEDMKVRYALSAFALCGLFLAACSDDTTGPAPGGSTPSTAFNTSSMPVEIANTDFSIRTNLAFDGAGNVLIPEQFSLLHNVNRITGKAGLTAAVLPRLNKILVACIYDPTADRIYVAANNVGSSGEAVIYSLDPNDLSATTLLNLGINPTLLQLLIAPDGFGAIGGHLIVLSAGPGTVSSIDLSNPVAVVPLATVLLPSDMEFAPDGSLYVASYLSDKVVKVTSSGTQSDFVTISNPVGIAINGAGTMMYVGTGRVSSLENPIYAVTIPGAVATVVDSAFFAIPGWTTRGMVVDGNTLIYIHDQSGKSAKVLDFVDL